MLQNCYKNVTECNKHRQARYPARRGTSRAEVLSARRLYTRTCASWELRAGRHYIRAYASWASCELLTRAYASCELGLGGEHLRYQKDFSAGVSNTYV